MKTDHIKKRNMLMQVVLAIITLGIYVIYWYYSTLKELHIANGTNEGSGMWTFFLFIPILNYFATWHYSSEAAAFTNGKYPAILLFLLWLFGLGIVVWILVQMELNNAAAGGASQPAAA